MGDGLTTLSVAHDRSGRVKLTVVIWLIVIGSAVYTGIAFGAVYFHKFQLADAVTQELSFAGQRADASIRQRILDRITAMGLPAEARNFQFARTGSPQALQVSISYTETVNLVFTEQPIRVNIQARRTF